MKKNKKNSIIKKGKSKKDKKAFIFIFKSILILIITVHVIADRFEYNEVVNLIVECDEIKIKHHHDWSVSTKKKRLKMMDIHKNPFSEDNGYAYIECIDKKTGKRLFKKNTPALTKIHISKDLKYIVGLSKIKLDNPYQLVIFDIKGNLIKKRHIASSEAKLTLDEYNEFKHKYLSQYTLLDSLDRITYESKQVYIDFLNIGLFIESRKAWEYLYEKEKKSHLSSNFVESSLNWIHWYHEKDPEIQVVYKNGKIFSISLLDSKGERFEIPIQEPTPEEVLTVGNFGLMLDR